MKPGDLVSYTWRGTSPNIGLLLERDGMWIRILWSPGERFHGGVQEFTIMDPHNWRVVRETR